MLVGFRVSEKLWFDGFSRRRKLSIVLSMTHARWIDSFLSLVKLYFTASGRRLKLSQ